MCTAKCKFLIFGRYFPCCDNSETYKNNLSYFLGFIDSVIDANPGFGICILGDLNFEYNRGRVGYNMFENLASEHKLVCCDDLITNGYAYTYRHPTLLQKSWLDHVFVEANLKNLVNNQVIIDDQVNISDYLLIVFYLNVDCSNFCQSGYTKLNRVNELRWDKGDTKLYYSITCELLSKINHNLNCDSVMCNCVDVAHCVDIDVYYQEIVHCLNSAANLSILSVLKSALKHYRSAALDNLKINSKSVHDIWVNLGKPIRGPIFDQMKDAKYKYKLAIRDVVKTFENRYSDELFVCMLNKDIKTFWKKWKSKRNGKDVIVPNIDGGQTDREIADVFMSKFNFGNLGNNPDGLSYKCNEMYDVSTWKFSVNDIDCVVIQKLKSGKAAGFDNISSEHVKYSHPILIMYLKNLFNLIVKHGYVPKQYGDGIIIPLVKDKNGDPCNSDNYRGITLCSTIFKIFELCMVDKFGSFLKTSDLQLGFKKDIGCGPAVFILQQVTNYFHTRGSRVFLSAVDASKAFDRIDHKILVNKLREHNVPLSFVNVIADWYSKLYLVVRWNGVFSNRFKVSCGIHQGQILSPFLFNFYVDELITDLQNSGYGFLVVLLMQTIYSYCQVQLLVCKKCLTSVLCMVICVILFLMLKRPCVWLLENHVHLIVAICTLVVILFYGQIN